MARGAFEPAACDRCAQVLKPFEHVFGGRGGLYCGERCRELHEAERRASARARLEVLRAALEGPGAAGFVHRWGRGWYVTLDGSTTPSPYSTRAAALEHAGKRAAATLERLALEAGEVTEDGTR
jgi:hypothetical protein